MPRIRSLKPEFWSSPGIETISPWARLLYMAMWNWADDAGRGTCNLRELQSFAFPHDEESEDVGTSDGFRRVMSEVRGQFGVVFYKVNGRPYYEIPSFVGHQRNERVAKGKYPTSSEGEPWDFMPPTREGAEAPTTSVVPIRKMSAAPTTSGTGYKEQGNRGTGDSAPNGAGAASPIDVTPNVVVAAWVEAFTAPTGRQSPPTSMRSQAGKEAKQLLDGGAVPHLVVEAARLAGDKGYATLQREYAPLVRANGRPAGQRLDPWVEQ